MSEKAAGKGRSRHIVISGGTDGMGRALALERLKQGDTVTVIGRSRDKGAALLEEASKMKVAGSVDFVPADLSSITETYSVADYLVNHHDAIDALALFANRQAPKRVVSAEGLEKTFALYYLSRFILSHELRPLLRISKSPVVVNVAGTGMKKGKILWEDMQLSKRYSMVKAQLQAGRANDLLGVSYPANDHVKYVLYHPGFTRSGDLSPLPAAARATIRALAAVAARPVAQAIAPIHGFIDRPPTEPLTAIDRVKSLPLTFPTLDPDQARRLHETTSQLIDRVTTTMGSQLGTFCGKDQGGDSVH